MLKGVVPKEWVECTITPIYKKGTHNDPNNYCRVALLSTGGKVFGVVLTQSLLRVLVPEVAPESQYAYQPGRSAEDLIYVVRQFFEKARVKNTQHLLPAASSVDPLYQIFPVKGD